MNANIELIPQVSTFQKILFKLSKTQQCERIEFFTESNFKLNNMFKQNCFFNNEIRKYIIAVDYVKTR